MMTKKLEKEYFEWMYQLVFGTDKSAGNSYRKLLRLLYTKPFIYAIDMDGNRAEDGVDLRYRFGYEESYGGAVIASYLDNRDCSVLEMMVALAFRCEEQIMDNPEAGNRLGYWFQSMLCSLGLDSMRDDLFDEEYVETVINIFLERRYEPNGKGGLFHLRHKRKDLRTVEIWNQMCWFLDELCEEE